ncbi:MAG: GerMN domain-containing protein [Ignavibacteriales bacterium]
MKRILACLMLPALAAAIAGCMPLGPQAGPTDTPVDPNPPEKSLTVVLHFPDKAGRWLEMEPRPVSGNERHEVIALAEWVKGPKSPTLGQFLPAGTTAELVETKDGTAFVSLSPQIKSVDQKYMSLVLQALVNTMTEVPGISRVQILVNGKKEESLARKIFAGEPVQRDMNCVARQGYRPIPDYDLDAREMVITGLVSAVDTGQMTISLTRVRVPPEVYSGSGRRPVRIEGKSSGGGLGGGTSGNAAAAGAPQSAAVARPAAGAPPATGMTPPAGDVPVRMIWRPSEGLSVRMLGDIQTRPEPGSVVLAMPLKVAPDVIVHEEDESFVEREIALSDVDEGDIVRIILTSERIVRSIVVCYQEE